MSANLYASFRPASPGDRAAPCLIPSRGPAHTHGDLEAASARYAGLLQRLDVHPGDRVAVQVEKSPEALCLYLACLRAGAIFLPLNSAYTEAELAYFIDDAEPRLVVCHPDAEAGLRALCDRAGVAHLLTLGTEGDGSLPARAQDLPDTFDTLAVSEDDIAAMLYTSGTTGRPKGAMLSHRNLSWLAGTLARIWAFSRDDVLLHALPIFHGHGLFVSTNVVLTSGASMLFLPRFDAVEVCRLLPRATAMMGVPTFYNRLLRQPELDAGLCRHVRLFTSGSAPLLPETLRAFEARTGHRVLERYGTTEAGIVSSNPIDGERRPGAIGLPLPGLDTRVVDDEGNTLGTGEPGALLVRGPCVFRGYWNLPDKTREAFTADGFFRTGDIAQADAGGYLTLVGRESDMIISGGYNVYPREVEAVLDALGGIEESAVIGVPHPDFGEAVVALVRLEPGARIAEADVREALRTELANYKVPKRVLVVDELPRNALGKIVKARLREGFRDVFST